MLDTNAETGTDAAQAAEGRENPGGGAEAQGQLDGGAGAPESGAPPEGEGKPEGDAKPAVTKQPWAHKRIDELTAQRYEQQRRADEAERRAQAAEARAEALERARQQGDAGHADQGREPAPKPLTQAEFDKAVAQRAAEQRQIEEFNRGANAAFDSGVKAYGEDTFKGSLQNLGRALGGLPQSLVEAAIETDNAAAVLHALGQDPEEAQRVMGLPPTRMAVAVAKLASKPVTPPPVSRAPAPISPVNGAARSSPDPDKLSTEEWMAQRRAGKIK